MMPGLTLHEKLLDRIPSPVVVVDTAAPDRPIVFVNEAFSEATGLARSKIIGLSCERLEGAGGGAIVVQHIEERRAFKLRTGRDTELEFSPLSGTDGTVSHYVGVEAERNGAAHEATRRNGATADAVSEINHRVKNHLAMVVAMIRMQAREANANSPENYATLARRIETLQLLYCEMTTQDDDDGADVALDAYLSRIVTAIAAVDGRPGLGLDVDLDSVEAPIRAAAQMGLLLSEVLTNAYKHAFVGRDRGTISVKLECQGDGSLRLEVSDDGVGLAPSIAWPREGNLGGRIVRSLLVGLDATLDVTACTEGTRAVLNVPAERIGPLPVRPRPPCEEAAPAPSA